ncbi:MAG: dockerin type I repeat-containing protein [Clostridiales bacterium]|nr:dockerin type I repeat-containing protein [Clostridiales bacterium]
MKKFSAILLAAVMLLTLIPAMAFAGLGDSAITLSLDNVGRMSETAALVSVRYGAGSMSSTYEGNYFFQVLPTSAAAPADPDDIGDLSTANGWLPGLFGPNVNESFSVGQFDTVLGGTYITLPDDGAYKAYVVALLAGAYDELTNMLAVDIPVWTPPHALTVLVPDEDAAGILSSPAFQADPAYREVFDLQENGISDWYTLDEGAYDKEELKKDLKSLDGKAAVYLPTGKDACLPDSGALNCSIYSVLGYQGGIEGKMPPVDNSLILTKEGAGTLTMSGDNSWYNGVFNLGHKEQDNTGNALIFDEDGAIFGGKVNLYKNTVCEWQGGVKDPYHRPTITLYGNAVLDFNLTRACDDDDTFSVYGEIKSDDTTPTVRFTKGTVFIKGDCSGFVGNIIVENGASFEIRKDPEKYEGKMFGGDLNIMNEHGTEGTAYIYTNSGLQPLTVSTGVIVIDQLSDEPVEENALINEITVGPEGKVVLRYGDTMLEGTKIHGELALVGGENVAFDNLKIDGGLLRIIGENLSAVRVTGDFSVGSSIINENEDRCVIDATDADMQIPAGRTFTLSGCDLIAKRVTGGTLELINSSRFVGDANCDNQITAADAAAILRHLVQLKELSEQGLANARVTKNTQMSAADAARILRWLVQLEANLLQSA